MEEIYKLIEYRGKKEGALFPYLREKGIGIDIHSLSKFNLDGVEWFKAVKKTITPKNGNKPFEVLEIIDVYKPDKRNKFLSYQDGVVSYSYQTVEYEIEHYRKSSGVKYSNFSGIVTKTDTVHITEVKPMVGLTTEQIEFFMKEYQDTHNKYSEINFYDLISLNEAGATFKTKAIHFLKGEIELDITVEKELIKSIWFDESNGNGRFYFNEELKTKLNTNLIYSSWCFYRPSLGEINSSWFSVNITESFELTKSKEYNLFKNETIKIDEYNTVKRYNYSFNGIEATYRKITSNSTYKTTFSDTFSETLFKNFFQLSVKETYYIPFKSVISDLMNINKHSAVMLQLLIEGKHEYECDINKLAEKLKVDVNLLIETMIILTEKHFPEITIHDFNEIKGFYFIKDNSYLKVKSKSEREFIVSLDTPSEPIRFLFDSLNKFNYEKVRYSGGDTEHYRWGSFTSEVREYHTDFTESDLKHFGVDDIEAFKNKFNDLYNRLNQVWNEIMEFKRISMFNNILNHYQKKHSELLKEVFSLMEQYHVEKNVSSGGGYGFWIPD